jgi:DNA polymerase/3'-5' exonuclease PolX
MKLETAREIAEQVIAALRPACDKIEVAGSIRREKPEVGDIEIVCQVKNCSDLFGEQYADLQALGAAIQKAISAGWLNYDSENKNDGERYKRFRLLERSDLEICCDLFIAVEANYGNTLAIRTGDAEFSKAMVSDFAFGGLKREGVRQYDGFLREGGTIIPCPTEQDYFDALGIPYVEPRDRTQAKAIDLRRQITEART